MLVNKGMKLENSRSVNTAMRCIHPRHQEHVAKGDDREARYGGRVLDAGRKLKHLHDVDGDTYYDDQDQQWSSY